MDAAEKMREYKRAYGNTLRTIRRAESLERAIRNEAPRDVIEKKVAAHKQAVAKSGPIVCVFRGTGVTLSSRRV